MVRSIILIAALFVAAVSAAPSPDPLVGAKAKHIGLHDIFLNRLGRHLVSAKRLKAHDILQGANVGGENGGVLKRDETPTVTIAKQAGTKGFRRNAKNKGAAKGARN
ncbi:hypothetical protein INT47_008074 [Mucor saturninus]|uniref:Uncharacterized protein n=1 Tax=Mucor saturninus TaxID=64648 RepID=A0A8H7V501_9FUNG|nr:hypothetical protein INT47_008074 [Mucor saturninus]